MVHGPETSPSSLVPLRGGSRSSLEDEHEDDAITILMVERDPATGDALAQRLRGRGYSVELLSSGTEASTKLEDDGYDVVVVGWELADASGLELLRRVRMRHAAADLPVVMVAEREGTEEVVRAFDRGASDVITKPVNFDIAIARIHSHVSLRRARLALRRQALVDDLTGLYNRRHIVAQLTTLAAAARRYDYPLSLCICDVDRFKTVNDTHGHMAGDAVLRHLGWIIRQRVRRCDVVGRFGGDELCVIFPHTRGRDAAVPTEDIRRAFVDSYLAHDGRAVGRLTASFGLAELGADAESVEELVAAADQALYQAKELGRNRICLRGAQTYQACCSGA